MSRLVRRLLAVATAALPLAPLAAQRPLALPLRDRALADALARLRADNAFTLEQQASICEIPAPPFKEQARAAEFMRRLAAFGIDGLRTDAVGNVIGLRRGAGGGPLVVLSAHLDTVFPEGTDVRVTRDTTGGRTVLAGPGIGDDCRGLASLIAVARAMQAAKVRTAGDILFVGTVGEEGPGNLRGVRALFEGEYKGRIDYFLSVDGTGFGVTTGAVGSNRYRVAYTGPGGHSYGAFGMPNPVHALGRAIAKVAAFEVSSAAGRRSTRSPPRRRSRSTCAPRARPRWRHSTRASRRRSAPRSTRSGLAGPPVACR